MDKNDSDTGELEKEYDLTKLRVRKLGKDREKFQLSEDDEMLPEYNFDYSKSKPNRFAEEYWKNRKK